MHSQVGICGLHTSRGAGRRLCKARIYTYYVYTLQGRMTVTTPAGSLGQLSVHGSQQLQGQLQLLKPAAFPCGSSHKQTRT